MSAPAEIPKEKAAVISSKSPLRKSIIDLLCESTEKGVFDAVLIPMRVPSGDSFAYVLIKDISLLKESFPLPPVMAVQGAKAVSSVTRLGKGNMKIAAMLRPCEIRAIIELVKLNQIKIENITLLSIDCPGVMPHTDFIKDPEKSMDLFDEARGNGDDTIMRPICKICDKSSIIAGDLHIGTLGTKKDTFFLIAHGKKGEDILDELSINQNEKRDTWNAEVKKITATRQEKRKNHFKELKSKISGLDNLVDTFSQCVNCHNCMRVCPICSCRLCYFDSDKVKYFPDDYLERAERKGCIRFPQDTTLFHMGRMMHMSLSCVSCGACEDACPVSIPVAQLFSMIADETQGLFDYVSGRNLTEPLPLVAYKEKELAEMEDAHD